MTLSEGRYHKWVRSRPVLFASILVLLTGCGVAGVQFGIGPIEPLSTDVSGLPQEVVVLVNLERADRGLGELVWNDKLAQAAAEHATDMAERGYFSHFSPEGEAVTDRATRAGYHWIVIGENIASGQTTPETVMRDWMNSPGHRANILREQFVDIWVAVSISGLGQPYWVQVFGKSW